MGRDETKVRDGHQSGVSFSRPPPFHSWHAVGTRPIRLDAGARPGVTLARPATGWGSGPVCNKNPGAAAKSMTDTCRGPRPHRNLIGCPRNQGPGTRTSLLRHQLSRRNPSPVHKAYEAWAAWKMLPHRHRSDVPRTRPDILEPSGDSASGCIAPKPSPDPVLTPSNENPVNPQGRAASRIRIRGIGTPRPRAFVRGSGGRHICGNPRIEMHTGDKRLQRRDMELTRYLHADIHHASAPAACALGRCPSRCLLSRRHEVVGVEIEVRQRGGIDEPDLNTAPPTGVRLEENTCNLGNIVVKATHAAD